MQIECILNLLNIGTQLHGNMPYGKVFLELLIYKDVTFLGLKDEHSTVYVHDSIHSIDMSICISFLLQFIFDASVKYCVEIATHQHGCCVLQRCIYYAIGKNRDRLISEICKHGLHLAQDPFG